MRSYYEGNSGLMVHRVGYDEIGMRVAIWRKKEGAGDREEEEEEGGSGQ